MNSKYSRRHKDITLSLIQFFKLNWTEIPPTKNKSSTIPFSKHSSIDLKTRQNRKKPSINFPTTPKTKRENVTRIKSCFLPFFNRDAKRIGGKLPLTIETFDSSHHLYTHIYTHSRKGKGHADGGAQMEKGEFPSARKVWSVRISYRPLKGEILNLSGSEEKEM